MILMYSEVLRFLSRKEEKTELKLTTICMGIEILLVKGDI